MNEQAYKKAKQTMDLKKMKDRNNKIGKLSNEFMPKGIYCLVIWAK